MTKATDNFYPFESQYGGSNEADVVIEALDLSKARLALLWQLLRRFEINIWFEDDESGGNPRLTLNTFWDLNHVASMPLAELLQHVVIFREDAQDIGRDKEITALTKLKNLIEQAIASRQQRQPNDAEAAA